MVASVLSKVRTPTGGKLTPMSAKQVRQATSAANAAARSAVVTPAACKELSLKASSVPETAGVGMATATGGKVVVALVIGKDPDELKSRVTGARELLQTCAKVTLKSAKQTVSQTLTPLTMDRVGDDSVAVLNTQSTSGVTVVMTQLSAWKGNRMVTVSGVGKPSDASDLAELGQLATKALTTAAAGGGATA
ncbi:hypothetical protein GCM10011512_01540 [Tersicoccus solisilvae]|uniref:Uncharacterized protein n=2 Tax=Tersicoccus solisilvae TaxID=1882339 RepID=A0ABQ1NKB0_9MICC|nr:hypothetical protein GCM10011512_01540 [Tersicoccus solisilvae]